MDQFKSAIESGAIQIGMEAGLKGLGGLANLVISSKTRGNDLKEKLLLLKPTIDDLIERSSHLDLSTEESEQYRVFQAVLRDGLHHVEESNQIETLDVVGKYFSGTEIQKFEEQIQCFNDIHGPPNLVRDIKKLRADVQELGQQVTLFQQQINPTQLSQTPINGLYGENNFNPPVSDMPEFVAGLDKPMKDVKEILMHESVNIVGVRGMGGSGKTTLALALCNDPEVQDFFHKNIVFLTVGQSPNVKGLLETMWERIIGDTVPTFQSIEDAHNQMKNNLKRIAEDLHVLVVLDDVWPTPKLKRLFFEAKGYKTIATTRHDSTIPETKNARLYSMPLLEEAHALSLFSFWAFDGRHSIPTTEPEDLVKQVTAQCKGLPLALEVIGSSLRRKPWPIWENAKEKLSRAEPISQDHIDDLLSCLATSIDILDVKQKQCFLDLGAFPKGRKFSVDSLLDIWVYLRGMEWADAFEVLFELASRNLLNLTGNPGLRSVAVRYSCASELTFSQHDVMRDLAVRLASQDSNIHCKRLFMPRKEAKIPKQWLSTLKDQSSRAQFVSFHTGAMQEQDWCQVDFPEVEALALFFAANQYCLPTFLHSMPKLKVLIIYNYSSMRAKLSGLPRFPSPVQIRSVFLNKLIVPSPLYENCRSWERLEKLSVCLCEGFGNITLLDRELEPLNFPNLVEISFDHCSDLGELPVKLFTLTSLERLSVTNCHLIQNLPDDIGRLTSLLVLRLSACPSLSRLPLSICKLGKLKYFDISQCRCVEDLPTEFDQLSNLETFDMRECPGLKKPPKVEQRSLKRVIISDNDRAFARAWLLIKASTVPNLTIDVVAESFNLDWLDD